MNKKTNEEMVLEFIKKVEEIPNGLLQYKNYNLDNSKLIINFYCGLNNKIIAIDRCTCTYNVNYNELLDKLYDNIKEYIEEIQNKNK